MTIPFLARTFCHLVEKDLIQWFSCKKKSDVKKMTFCSGSPKVNLCSFLTSLLSVVCNPSCPRSYSPLLKWHHNESLFRQTELLTLLRLKGHTNSASVNGAFAIVLFNVCDGHE